MNPPLLWFVAGALLCLTEAVVPNAFVTFMMGVGAFLTAGVALLVPSVGVQVAVWLGLSVLLVALALRFLRGGRQAASLKEADEAETLTEIPPGQTGRVLYEGNSWRAQCGSEGEAIAARQKVYVLRREGNTLIVLPLHLLRS